jgi:hypothetical protein
MVFAGLQFGKPHIRQYQFLVFPVVVLHPALCDIGYLPNQRLINTGIEQRQIALPFLAQIYIAENAPSVFCGQHVGNAVNHGWK